MSAELFFRAFSWGFISAISAPLGAMTGLSWHPPHKVRAAFMSFGAGALIFALTVVLFGNALDEKDDDNGAGVYLMIIMSIVGSLFFQWVNRLLNQMGGFERKWSTMTRQWRALVGNIGRKTTITGITTSGSGNNNNNNNNNNNVYSSPSLTSPSLRTNAQSLRSPTGFGFGVDKEYRASLATGQLLPTQSQLQQPQSQFAALFSPRLRQQSQAQAQENTPLISDNNNNTDDDDSFIQNGTGNNNKSGNNHNDNDDDDDEDVANLLDQQDEAVVRDVVNDGHDVGMAVWLGLLIDGFPESIIIGVMAVDGEITISFILAVFLSNFPEAMSSADLMSKAGYSRKTILGLWWFLAVYTGFFAAVFAVIIPENYAENDWHYALAGIEGLAGGAMLTVVSQTMLPEAFEGGGDVTGFSCVIGFLSSLLVNVLFDDNADH